VTPLSVLALLVDLIELLTHWDALRWAAYGLGIAAQTMTWSPGGRRSGRLGRSFGTARFAVPRTVTSCQCGSISTESTDDSLMW
jgi:hypothetical protein